MVIARDARPSGEYVSGEAKRQVISAVSSSVWPEMAIQTVERFQFGLPCLGTFLTVFAPSPMAFRVTEAYWPSIACYLVRDPFLQTGWE